MPGGEQRSLRGGLGTVIQGLPGLLRGARHGGEGFTHMLGFAVISDRLSPFNTHDRASMLERILCDCKLNVRRTQTKRERETDLGDGI